MRAIHFSIAIKNNFHSTREVFGRASLVSAYIYIRMSINLFNYVTTALARARQTYSLSHRESRKTRERRAVTQRFSHTFCPRQMGNVFCV